MPTFGKYHSRTTQYNGSSYDSALEASYAAFLDMCRKAHAPHERVVEVKRQHAIPLVVNGVKIATHYVDFQVTFADGHMEWREIKGFATDTWKLKRKLVLALYPETPYRVFTAGRSGSAFVER